VPYRHGEYQRLATQPTVDGNRENPERKHMRYVHISLIVVVTAVVLLFKIQNFDSVTVSLLGASITMPTSLLIIGVYILGMVSGSALLGLLRGSVKAAMRRGE
jgi:uncharacterized integral membrane protein